VQTALAVRFWHFRTAFPDPAGTHGACEFDDRDPGIRGNDNSRERLPEETRRIRSIASEMQRSPGSPLAFLPLVKRWRRDIGHEAGISLRAGVFLLGREVCGTQTFSTPLA
jgi:hypothetical protein